MTYHPIPNYEHIYLINEYGSVINIINGKEIAHTFQGTGRPKVELYKKGIRKNFKVHRLVALTFIPNPHNKPQINHIDGVKTNNHVSNLEWCTHRENADHAIARGLMGHQKLRIPKLYSAVTIGFVMDVTQYRIAESIKEDFANHIIA